MHKNVQRSEQKRTILLSERSFSGASKKLKTSILSWKQPFSIFWPSTWSYIVRLRIKLQDGFKRDV
jgi:hypothetical protein